MGKLQRAITLVLRCESKKSVIKSCIGSILRARIKSSPQVLPIPPNQSLSQRSKTRTSIADPGSASGGTFQCMQFLPFFIYFSYLFYLGHLSLLGLQTKTRRQSNSSTFCSFKFHHSETFMSSAASASVHATRKRSQKAPRTKSGAFRFPWMDFHDSRTIQ